MRTIDRFLKHCEDPNPGFSCFDYLDRGEEIGFSAKVKNLLHEGATKKSLKQLSSSIHDPDKQLLEFFRRIDGFYPYVDLETGYRPFELCSIPEWPHSTREMKKWYLNDGEEFFGNIDFLTNGIAIGKINRTPDYISIVSDGPNAGKIFHVAHDDFKYEPYAESFDQFITRMIDDPATFLNDIGAFAHYSDGQTDTKWCPKNYHPDMADIAR